MACIWDNSKPQIKTVRKSTQWSHMQKISHVQTRTDTEYYYRSFCLPLSSLESPILFLLSLPGETSVARVWCSLLPTSPDLFLSSQLNVVEDSPLDRLIAESANEDGTVTERLPCKSALRRSALELWYAVLSSGVDAAVDTVANLQYETMTIYGGHYICQLSLASTRKTLNTAWWTRSG